MHRKLFYCFILLLPILLNSVKGQVVNNDSIIENKRIKNLIDFVDLWKLIRNNHQVIKKDTVQKNLLGPFYTLIPYPGYAMVTGYLGGFVSNVSFYTHSGDDAKVSTILMNNDYTQYNQYINSVNSNVWLDHEKINLTGDLRLYKFPTNTYGLGSKSSLNDAVGIDYYRLRIYEVIMYLINKNVFGGLGYNYERYWNITETKNPSIPSPDVEEQYGLSSYSVSSGFTINFQYDDRLNCNNPEKGTYFYIQLRNNLKTLGSLSNWQSLTIDARKYLQLSKETGNVLALWSYDWLTLSGKPPYLDLPSLGEDSYNNTGRGYVEARFRGLNFLYGETEYRFRLLKNGLLGGVIFLNASSFSEWPVNRFEKINPGEGFGLRIKMNKESNTNFCADYGFGTGGSRGFSFNLNEIF